LERSHVEIEDMALRFVYIDGRHLAEHARRVRAETRIPELNP